MTIGHDADIVPLMNSNNLPGLTFLGRLLADLERKLLLRSYGLDPNATGKPGFPGDHIRDLFYEVKTKSGWRLWRRR